MKCSKLGLYVIPLLAVVAFNRYYLEEIIREALRQSPLDDYDFWYFFDSGQEFSNLGYAPVTSYPASDPEGWNKQLYVHLFQMAEKHSNLYTHWSSVKVVELASGKGGGLRVLTSHPWSFTVEKATGVERSYQGFLRAKNNHKGSDKVEFVNADARNLPFENKTHEIVLSLEANGILFRKTFTEIHRILKDDGVFVLSTIASPRVWTEAVTDLLESGFRFCKDQNFENITERVRQARDEQDPVMQGVIDRLLRKYLYVVYPLVGFLDEGFRRPHSTYYKKAFIDKEEVYLAACFQKCAFGKNCHAGPVPPIVDV